MKRYFIYPFSRIQLVCVLLLTFTFSLLAEVPEGSEKTEEAPKKESKNFDFFYWQSEYKDLYEQKVKELATLKEELATEKKARGLADTQIASQKKADEDKITALEKKIEVLEKELADEKKACEEKSKKRSEELGSLQKQLQVCKGGSSGTTSNSTPLDLQALRESLDKIQKRVDLADAKSLENQKIIENLKKTIAEDEKAMATVKQSLTGKEKEITDLEKKLAECHDNQVGLQGTIQNLQKENRDLQGKVKALSASLAEDSAKCEELKKKNAQAEEKLAQLENKNNQLSEEVSTLIQKNKDMASQHEKTAAMDKETIQKLQLENNKLNRTIDSVGLQHENLQKQNAKMRSLLLKLIRDRKEQKEKIANRYKELEDTFEKELEDGNIQFHKTSDRIVINLQDKISFKSGSSKLRSQIKPSLDKIVNIITKYPGYRVYIEGHTDDIPLKRKSGFKDNWELSTERALSVLRYMLANHDLEADRFSASGYGQYHPLFPNTSTENRRKNRRVDIVLMYTGKKAMGEEKEDESTQGPSLEVSPGSKEDSDPDFEIGK